MHCTITRTQSDISTISDRRKASLPLKPLEQLNVTTSEDSIESPVISRDIHDRCKLLTFLTLESDGNWKILAVPVQCADKANHSTCGSKYTRRSSSWSHGKNQPRSKAIQNSNLLPDNKTDRTVRTCANKRWRKRGKQGKKHISNSGSDEISLLHSHQGDLQGSLNRDRDVSEAIFSTSDHNVPEKIPVFGSENLLETNDIRFPDSPSSNGSSELDIALVSSDGGGLQIDLSASDKETVEIRHKELLNSDPGQRVLDDAIDLSNQREEIGRGNNQSAAKRSYRIKTAVNSPNVSRLCIFENSNSNNTGKENSHPVWQKVQRKLRRECGSAKVNSKIPEKNEASSSQDKRQIPIKISGKLKRKQYPASKQESNRHLRKGSSSNKSKLGSSNKSSHSIAPGVVSPSGNTRDRLRTCDADSLNLEPVHDSHVCRDGSQHNGHSGNCAANSDNEFIEDGNSSSGESRVDLNITSSAMCLPHLLANRVARSDKEDGIPDSCRQKSTSGSSTQIWVPVGTKTPASTGLTSKSCISVDGCHAEACQEDTPTVNSESNVSLSTSEAESVFPPREKGHTEPKENKNSHVGEGQNHREDSDISLCWKLKGQFQSDLDRIAMAVDHAHMAQLASEAVQMATGGPIAEFERLLHLSSPVLCLSRSISSCKMCSRNHSFSSLCIHERPDIPLGCLWEWYQKHGSFGLEVRGKDYNNSKRLGIDRFSFRAYFVPYLSAVQLFGTGKRQMRKSLSGDADTRETCDNSTVGHLPIFPLLVPRSSKEEIAPRTVESAESNEAELIFEYFELEQPQQRRPLYEKIQELVRGEGPSGDKDYGNTSKLHSTSLQDLDPRSWYSVAWYPIYRIPDGKFRAAFLTYHSLGHLVRRNGIEGCVVSPVVGLQSYNAQDECWLQLRPSVMSQKSQILGLDPSKILKERLRTLEEAASLMSRAAVSKGNNLTSVNKHRDYEFFLSRRQYY